MCGIAHTVIGTLGGGGGGVAVGVAPIKLFSWTWFDLFTPLAGCKQIQLLY